MKKTILFLIFFIYSSISYAEFNLDDNIRGYLSFNKIKTTGSEFFTNGYYAVGLNLNYRFNNKIFFTTQVTSRNILQSNFKDIYTDNLFLEYILLNINMYNTNKSNHNLMLGRIKIPYGFYNKSRDTPFSIPSPILPQTIYLERLREFALSADGGIYKYSRFENNFNFQLDVGVGQTQIDDLVKFNFFPTLIDIIELKPENSYILNFSLDSSNLTYRFNYSYLNANAKSTNLPTNLNFTMNVFSFQFNKNKFSWTNEIGITRSNITNGYAFDTEGWYTQLEYFATPKLTLLTRYEHIDIYPQLKFLPKDNYSATAFNLRYKVTNDLNLNLFYSKNIGTFPLLPVSVANREPLHIQRHWDLFMFAIDYRF